MAYCRHCGYRIDDRAVICPACGVPQGNVSRVNDTGSFGWGLLGCCVPLVGLILYLVWKDTKPRSAAAAGKGALVSVILYVAFYILFFAFGILAGLM